LPLQLNDTRAGQNSGVSGSSGHGFGDYIASRISEIGVFSGLMEPGGEYYFHQEPGIMPFDVTGFVSGVWTGQTSPARSGGTNIYLTVK